VQGNCVEEAALYHEELASRQLAQRSVPAWLLCDRMWPERAAPSMESSVRV
jgi:hypothetical protein